MIPEITINIGADNPWMVLWTALAAVGTLAAVFLSLYFASIDLRRQRKQEKLKIREQAEHISVALTTIDEDVPKDANYIAKLGFTIFNNSDKVISLITVFRGFPGTHLPSEHLHKTPFLAPGDFTHCPVYAITSTDYEDPQRHVWITFLDGRGISWVLEAGGQLRQGFINEV